MGALPENYTEPVDNFGEFAFLIHGEKKIGKTTLGMEGTGKPVLFLQCDPPQRAYRRVEKQLKTWKQSKEAIRELVRLARKRKNFPYGRIVLDGTDQWFDMCLNWVCQERSIEHPGDESYGGAWSSLRTEFTHGVTQLLNLPVGIWFLTHSTWKEMEKRGNKKILKLLPRLTGMAEEIINGRVDGWFAYDYDGKDRVLWLRGDESVGAGHRLDTEVAPHFRHRVSGKRLARIKTGRTSKQAFLNLQAAFYNKYPIKEKK